MPRIEFNCLPTMIGSLPYTKSAEACEEVFHYLKDIPAWPQLPRRDYKENMYVQYSEGFPGMVVKEDSMYVDRQSDIDTPLEALYAAYLENEFERYAITPDYASGLYQFLSTIKVKPRVVKGQVTGPFSWGLTVTDETKKAILYDDTLADAAARLLRLKATWQEKQLSRISKNTIIFVDEPYMVSFGSAYVSVSREKVIKLLEEVFGGISGLKGVHCCGNTDWSVLLATSTDIISFDAYNYAVSLSLYLKEVKEFLASGKVIAWGIVPDNEEALAKETVASLKDRLEEAMAPFTRNNGIRYSQLLEQSLLTPSCGLASLSENAAAQALQLLSELSVKMRSSIYHG